MFFSSENFISYLNFVGKGILVTMQYSLLSVFIGLVLGSILAILGLVPNRSIRLLVRSYISIFRGTPLLLQLSIVYFGVPQIINVEISAFIAGVITFSLNSSAYIAEIIKSGINSIDRGQFEACRVLSIPYWTMMFKIILPQAYRNIMPALLNEIIDMFKETAIVSTIGEMDIMYRAKLLTSEYYDYFGPLLAAACCYYGTSVTLSYIVKLVENRLTLKLVKS